jgi:hydrogenase expression/formation protein HypE
MEGVRDELVLLAHGGGGKLMRRLIEEVFLEELGGSDLNDSSILDLNGVSGKLAFTTDAFVVDPIFFPGGDIGKLAICGTVNDLAAVGARPLWFSASFIVEEGMRISDLAAIASSMAAVTREVGAKVVAGDTKVVPRGKGGELFISVSGIGVVESEIPISGAGAKVGDLILINGPIGEHGIAVMLARENMGFISEVVSDCAPLWGMVRELIRSGCEVHAMRDPTRGGVAAALNEIAEQSGVCIEIYEGEIPIRPEVLGACELLGIDPLEVANEGKMLVFVPERDLPIALDHIPGGRAIGRVIDGPPGRVYLKTAIGARRIVEMPVGEILPRIC